MEEKGRGGGVGEKIRRGAITAATDCYIEYLIWIERLQLIGGGGKVH